MVKCKICKENKVTDKRLKICNECHRKISNSDDMEGIPDGMWRK